MAQLQKREKILIVASGLAVIFFVFNQFICGQKPEPPQQEITQQKQQPKPAAGEKAAEVNKTKPRVRNRGGKPKVMFSSWKRDPFAEAFRLAALDSTNNDSSFVLHGVIRNGDKAYVLIGDAILAKGERRGDLKILDIQEDRVVCRKRNRIVTLVLHNEK